MRSLRVVEICIGPVWHVVTDEFLCAITDMLQHAAFILLYLAVGFSSSFLAKRFAHVVASF